MHNLSRSGRLTAGLGWYRHYAIPMLTIMLCGWMVFVGGMAYGQEWKVVSHTDGIVAYTRPSGFSLNEVRAVGTVAAPLPVVEALLRDIPAEKRFGFRCTEAYRINIPGVKTAPDSFPLYYRMGLPYPVQDRDTIWMVHFFYNPATGILKADLQTLDTDYLKHTGVIRMRRGYATFVLTPLGQDRTEIDYTAQCDPGGSLPAFLVSMILKDFAPTTIARIRDVVKDTQYLAATKVVTKSPMP